MTNLASSTLLDDKGMILHQARSRALNLDQFNQNLIALGYNPDRTIRFTHRPACLARAKREHQRLLFPAPDGFFHDIEFHLFLGNTPHRLKDLTPRDQVLLFHALQHAGLTNTAVYVSVTGPFAPSDRSFSPQSVKILPAPTPARMSTNPITPLVLGRNHGQNLQSPGKDHNHPRPER